MGLERIREIIRRKPQVFFVTSVVYLLVTSLLKWGLHVNTGMFMYIIGGVIGIYFLDIAEVFFNLRPSPFRSIVFVGAFVVVSLFVVTSATTMEARGLVLSLYLTIVLWQIGQWQLYGNLDSWYELFGNRVAVPVQRIVLGVTALIFVFETYAFIK